MEPEKENIMQLLLDYGADARIADDKKQTLLHQACSILNQQPSMGATLGPKTESSNLPSIKSRAIRILLEYGADPKAENAEHATPAMLLNTDERRIQTQSYINHLNENIAERVKSKDEMLLLSFSKDYCNDIQRSFYRSIFDLADIDNNGSLRIGDLEFMLQRLVPKTDEELNIHKPSSLDEEEENAKKKAKKKSKSPEDEKSKDEKGKKPPKKGEVLPKSAKKESEAPTSKETRPSSAMKLLVPFVVKPIQLATAVKEEEEKSNPYDGLPVKKQHPELWTLFDFFRLYDKDKNGLLSFSEFLFLCLQSEQDKERLENKKSSTGITGKKKSGKKKK